jgi:hypothetical protein
VAVTPLKVALRLTRAQVALRQAWTLRKWVVRLLVRILLKWVHRQEWLVDLAVRHLRLGAAD